MRTTKTTKKLYDCGAVSMLVCVPEQVVLDSSSSFPQSLSPSHSQRRGMQRLFLHLNRSVGQVCWSAEKRASIEGQEEENNTIVER